MTSTSPRIIADSGTRTSNGQLGPLSQAAPLASGVPVPACLATGTRRRVFHGRPAQLRLVWAEVPWAGQGGRMDQGWS
jgi:hypothetical protein